MYRAKKRIDKGWLQPPGEDDPPGGTAESRKSRLTDPEEMSVRLVLFEGKTLQEAADARHVSKSTIRTNLERAIQKSGLSHAGVRELDRDVRLSFYELLEAIFPDRDCSELMKLSVNSTNLIEEFLEQTEILDDRINSR